MNVQGTSHDDIVKRIHKSMVRFVEKQSAEHVTYDPLAV